MSKSAFSISMHRKLYSRTNHQNMELILVNAKLFYVHLAILQQIGSIILP